MQQINTNYLKNIQTLINDYDKKNVRYQLWSLDVWGNEIDGYEVNNKSLITDNFIIPENCENGTLYKMIESITGTPAENMILSNQSDDLLLFIDFIINDCPMYQLNIY